MKVGARHWETIRPDNILYVLRQPETVQTQSALFYVVRKNEVQPRTDQPRRRAQHVSPEPLSRRSSRRRGGSRAVRIAAGLPERTGSRPRWP